MTKEQAFHFVKAGFFPESTEGKNELADIFGYLPYRFIQYLYVSDDLEVRKNIRTLANLIWDGTAKDSFERNAKEYFTKRQRLESAQEAFIKANDELQEAKKDFYNTAVERYKESELDK